MAIDKKKQMDDRVKSLPVWAQKHIRTLKLRIKEANKQLREQAGEEETMVIVNEGFGHEPSLLNAPDNARIRLYLDRKRYRWIEVRRELTREGDLGVQIYGSDSLSIHLDASNIAIATTRR